MTILKHAESQIVNLVEDLAAIHTEINEDVAAALIAADNSADADIAAAIAALTKASVGLANVDNTADVDKPVSTAIANAISEAISIAITTTIGTVTKADVGLSNVDNTSDLNKPVSIATLTAINTAVSDPILNKAVGHGIRVDTVNPTFPWKDLVGDLSTKTGTNSAPTLTAFRGGNCRRMFYDTSDIIDLEYHFPHDYLPNSDIFLHLHWGHNGTAISGEIIIALSFTYAKGHNQEIFPIEKNYAWVIPASNLTLAPRWGHVVSEFQLSSITPSASQLNTTDLETDGELIINFQMTTKPTISGGSTNKPYFGHLDIHYQSTGIGTKNKAPNFNV